MTWYGSFLLHFTSYPQMAGCIKSYFRYEHPVFFRSRLATAGALPYNKESEQ